MSIRCLHCDSRVPEWDSLEGCCVECYEQYVRAHSCVACDEEGGLDV